MSLLMAVTLSFFMSLIGTLVSGKFTVLSWVLSFAVSLVISAAIGFIVPMPKLEASACRKLKLRPGSVKANLLSAFISNTIYTPILSVVMVLIMVGAATAGIQKGIDALSAEINDTNVQIVSIQSELTKLGDSDPEKTNDFSALIGTLRGKLEELEGQKAGLEAGRPNMGMAILVSLLWCYPSGFVVIFIVQPLYLKMLLKKLGPPAGAPGGSRSGPPVDGALEGIPPRED